MKVLSALGALVAVVALAAPAQALPPSTFQIPLEVRPSQGPAGSSAILSAYGWQAGETVYVYVDGARVAGHAADASGRSAGIVPIPDTTPAENAVGVHRILLYGVASRRTAAGTFTTTPTGAARPALMAVTDPLDAGENPDTRYGRLLVVNFGAYAPVYGRWRQSGEERAFSIGRTGADGTLDTVGSWSLDTFGSLAVGASRPEAGAPVVAADALVGATDGTAPTRRVRALPAVGSAQQRILLLGDGFTPGAAVTKREWEDLSTTPLTALADGTVRAEDAGDSDDVSPSFRLDEDDELYGAAGAWRQAGSGTPATAAVLDDRAAPGEQVTVLGVGFSANAGVTLQGRDAANATSSATATTDGAGMLDTVFTIPAGAAPGGYGIRVSNGGVAHASLSVTGSLAPAALQLVGDLGMVALPHTGPSDTEFATREIEVCNDGTTAREVTLTDSANHVTVAPASATLAADECEAVTVTVSSEFSSAPGPAAVTITAAGGGATATRTLQVLKQTVAITQAPSGRRDGGVPFSVGGITDANRYVRVLALGYGDPPIDLGTASGDSAGNWLLPDVTLPRGSHVRFLAIPRDLPIDGDLSHYEPTDGVLYASRFEHDYEGWTWNDLVTTTTAFRDAGDPSWGIDDIGVLGPQGMHPAFDWAGSVAFELHDGYEPVPEGDWVTGLTADGAFAQRSYVLQPVDVEGVRLTRRYEVRADSRHVRVTDTIQNREDFWMGWSVGYGSGHELADDETEYRLSTWDDWRGDGAGWGGYLDSLVVWPDTPTSGWVAARSEDPSRAATTGHNFWVWHRQPDYVRLGTTRSQTELWYDVTVEANETLQIVHEFGTAPTDQQALALAQQLVQSSPPGDGDGDGDGDGGGGDGDASGDGAGGDQPPLGEPGPAPGPGPGATPLEAPRFGPPAGPRTPAPSVRAGTRLRDVLRSGLPVDFDLTGTQCVPTCPLSVELLVDRRTAKRLRMAAAAKHVVVGRRRVVFRDDVQAKVTVRLAKRARARLRRAKRVTFLVRATLTDALGGRSVAERRITLKR